MDELTKQQDSAFFATLRERYEELDRQLPELRRRVEGMSLVQRFVTESRVVKLLERLEVEEQEEALKGRLQAMQLMRVTALNEQQIRLRAILGVIEVESSAHLVDRATQIYNDLLDRLSEHEYQMVQSFVAHRARRDEIKDEAMRERYMRKLDVLLDQQEKVVKALIESTTQSLDRIRQAYAERSPTGKS
jgi:hypothetical protein